MKNFDVVAVWYDDSANKFPNVRVYTQGLYKDWRFESEEAVKAAVIKHLLADGFDITKLVGLIVFESVAA